MMAMSNLEALIQAAQYLEENGHDDEDDDEDTPSKRTSRNRPKKPSSYSRTTHNLLEKNRRAQLRDCLEVLRQHVPLPDKLTTLALLQSARKYIESLQQKEKEDDQLVVKLRNEQAYLLSRLVELGATGYVSSMSPTMSSEALPVNGSQSTVDIRNRIQHPTLSPNKSCRGRDEDESMVIDVTTHESEDETSSTSSASDSGCTSTSHKYEHAT